MEDAREETQGAVKAYIEDLEGGILPSSEMALKAISDRESEYNVAMDRTTEESKRRFQSLREDIDKAEQEWMEHLTQMKLCDLAEIGEKRQEVNQQIARTKEALKTCKHHQQNSNDNVLLSFLSGLEKDTESVDTTDELDISLPLPPHFLLSHYSLPSCPELIGIISRENTEGIHIRRHSKRVKKSNDENQFDTRRIEINPLRTVGGVTALALVHNKANDVWVNKERSQTLTLYDENFIEKNSLKIDFKIKAMVLSQTDDIIATDATNKCVVRIQSSGEISTICNIAPLYPWGICINDRQQIVVGVRGSPKEHVVKLMVLSPDGSSIVQEIEKDRSGQLLFTERIYQVRQSSTGDYIVADGGRIVVVSRDGEYRWSHHFDGSLMGLAIDRYGNIISADYMNNKIYLIGKEGVPTRTLMTKKDGIRYPDSLSIDNHGVLWIGEEEDVKVVQYLK